eukprot:gene11991-1843_t
MPFALRREDPSPMVPAPPAGAARCRREVKGPGAAGPAAADAAPTAAAAVAAAAAVRIPAPMAFDAATAPPEVQVC